MGLKRNRFIHTLLRCGFDITWYDQVGSQCPCWTHGSTGYNPDWHASNPSEPDCDHRTGILDSEEEAVSLKVQVWDNRFSGNGTSTQETSLKPVGEYDETDFIILGSVKTDGTYYPVVDRDGYFVYNGDKYTVIEARPVMETGEQILLRKYE